MYRQREVEQEVWKVKQQSGHGCPSASAVHNSHTDKVVEHLIVKDAATCHIRCNRRTLVGIGVRVGGIGACAIRTPTPGSITRAPE